MGNAKALKVLILRGLPGSGKTFWALKFMEENPGWKRVNKDTLRTMLWGNSKPGKHEGILDTIQDQAILELLGAGWNVIVDNTNLSGRRIDRINRLVAGGKVPVTVEIKNFFDTPLLTCIKRDASRANPVGQKVIYDMYVRFVQPQPVLYQNNLPDAYICDIDGTAGKMDGRGPFAYEKAYSDLPNFPVMNVVRAAVHATQSKLIFVSGRPDTYKDLTIDWIRDNGIADDYLLHMRKEGDYRTDSIIKKEIYEEYIKGKYNVLGVFDDRERVVWMWRQEGLTVFHVDYGLF